MNARKLGVHAGLFGVSALLAFRVMVAEDAPPSREGSVVWETPITQLQRVEYEVRERSRLVLEPKQDEVGRYFVASFEKTEAKRADPADAGAGAEQPAAERKTTRFIAGEKAEELAQSLAKFEVRRDLGVPPTERLSDYGLDGDDVGTLNITLAGRERRLRVGGKAPGDGDVYVQSEEGGEVYVVPSSVIRDLEAPENRLMQRALHAWEATEAVRVDLTAGERTASFVRQNDNASFWASPERPDEKDETASNWMTKFERLRISRYVESLEPAPELVVRAEFRSEQGKLLGFVELAQGEDAAADSQPGGASKVFYARSEGTRWWGAVLSSAAEPLAQDLGSIMQ